MPSLLHISMLNWQKWHLLKKHLDERYDLIDHIPSTLYYGISDSLSVNLNLGFGVRMTQSLPLNRNFSSAHADHLNVNLKTYI